MRTLSKIASVLVVVVWILSSSYSEVPGANKNSPPGTIPSLTGGLPAQIMGPNTNAVGGEYKSENLYTPQDKSASGGISLKTNVPVESAYAVPQNNQYLVFKGDVGPDKKSVAFSGLPIAKYDIMVVCRDVIYEGFVLNRDENNLTPQDLKFIDVTIKQSIPFFDFKRIERVKGTSGKEGKASAVVQEMRIDNFLNQNGDFMTGHQLRSIKLVFCEDVGTAGWQVFQTREIIRTDVFPNMPHGPLPIKYVDGLGGIRVTTAVKNIGEIQLPNP